MLLLVILAALGFMQLRSDPSWGTSVAAVAGGLFGWRFSWHLMMYPIMEYDGGYATDEEMARQTARYRRSLVATVPLSVVAVLLVWRFLLT